MATSFSHCLVLINVLERFAYTILYNSQLKIDMLPPKILQSHMQYQQSEFSLFHLVFFSLQIGANVFFTIYFTISTGVDTTERYLYSFLVANTILCSLSIRLSVRKLSYIFPKIPGSIILNIYGVLG